MKMGITLIIIALLSAIISVANMSIIKNYWSVGGGYYQVTLETIVLITGSFTIACLASIFGTRRIINDRRNTRTHR